MPHFEIPQIYKALHGNTWMKLISELKYKPMRKSELIRLEDVCALLGWEEEEVLGCDRLWIFHFVDGVWIYPLEVRRIMKDRWGKRLGLVE